MKTQIRPALRPLAGAACVGVALLLVPNLIAQNLFVASPPSRIYEFTTNGAQTIFESFPAGSVPYYLAFDGPGNLFVSLQQTNILKITPQGVKSNFASVSLPTGLAFDRAGNLFVAGQGNGTLLTNGGFIAEIATNGEQTTFASGFDPPIGGLAFDSAGDLFMADSQSNALYEFTNQKATLNSNATLFASGLQGVNALAFDSMGDLFVGVSGSAGGQGRIYEYTNYQGILSTNSTLFVSGLDGPGSLAFDSAGNLFATVGISGTLTGAIFEITPAGLQSTFATNVPGFLDGLAFQGIKLPVTAPPVFGTFGIGADGAFQLNVLTPPQSTIVQASTDLMNWADVYTDTPPFFFTDPSATTNPYRFYRALLGP